MSSNYFPSKKITRERFLEACAGSELVLEETDKFTCWHRIVRATESSVWALDSKGYIEFEQFLPQARAGDEPLKILARVLDCVLVHEHCMEMITPEGEVQSPPWTLRQLRVWSGTFGYRRDLVAEQKHDRR